MRYSVQKRIDIKDLPRILPKRFQGLVDPQLENDGTVTVIIFGGEKVIRSSQVRFVLKELSDADHTILAYAYNLTTESKEILQANRVQIYTESDWYWTDESYSAVRSYRSERKL